MIRGRNIKWWLGKGLLALRHPWLTSRRISYDVKRFFSDILAFFGYYKYPHRIIFLAGMAMSASTWMKNLLGQIPGYYTRPMLMPFEIGYECDTCDEAFIRFPRYGYTLVKSHLNPKPENLEVITRHGVEKVLITYRDLRDIALSRYHRLMNVPKPEDAPDYIDYRTMNKEEAINHSIGVVGDYYFPWIKDWFEVSKKDPDKYKFVKFEDLKKDTVKVFKEVIEFYGVSLSDAMIEKIVENARGKGDFKKNYLARNILPFALASNFRSGKGGQWKKEFTSENIEKCKEVIGSALVELGYEKDLNW